MEQAQAEAIRRLKGMIRRYARRDCARRLGELDQATDKETGATRSTRDADDSDAGKYEVICEDHGTLVGVESMAAARATSTIDFCDDCREAAAGGA